MTYHREKGIELMNDARTSRATNVLYYRTFLVIVILLMMYEAPQIVHLKKMRGLFVVVGMLMLTIIFELLGIM